MTGYESKKAAAQAKTIDEVNWADHEPNGLAQPAQEPVAWMSKDEHEVYTSKQVDGYFQHDHIPLYTTPPQRPWVGLTEEEIALIDWESLVTKKDCVRAIEAKLKERNT